MSKAKNLTPQDKARIRAMHAQKLPNGRCRYSRKVIAEANNVHVATVSRAVTTNDDAIQPKKRGPKFKLNECARRRVVRYFLHHPGSSAPDAIKELGLQVSAETVRRFMRDLGAQYVKLKTTPPLTDTHKAARVSFSKQHLHSSTDFRKWIWSDEKSVEQFKSKRALNGGGIMVWGAIRHDHTVALTEVTVRMNSEVYQTVLSDHLLPYWDEFKACGIVFQQDNAPCHTSRSTADWFRARDINPPRWPALSPDLSPIENIWAYMVKDLYGPGKPIFRSLAELRVAIFQAWSRIPSDVIESCTRSVPKRLIDVLTVQGRK
ncbi:hypothetical protein FOL47_002890, partial [Perkinsus chesapeaki]